LFRVSIILRELVFGELACCSERYDELSSHAYLAHDANRASHLFDQLLADAEAQANTISVLVSVFFDGVEIDK
jgi:hypothetical protein